MLVRLQQQVSAISRCKVVTTFRTIFSAIWPVKFSNDAHCNFVTMVPKGLTILQIEVACNKLQDIKKELSLTYR